MADRHLLANATSKVGNYIILNFFYGHKNKMWKIAVYKLLEYNTRFEYRQTRRYGQQFSNKMKLVHYLQPFFPSLWARKKIMLALYVRTSIFSHLNGDCYIIQSKCNQSKQIPFHRENSWLEMFHSIIQKLDFGYVNELLLYE